MSSSKYITETYIFDPRPLFPLQLVAKRFSLPSVIANNDTAAKTLLFAHGAGFHKELWEPIIDDLGALVQREGGEGVEQGGHGNVEGGEGRVRIREIWTVDCPNHGDSAAVNAEALQYGYGHIFPWEDYARLLHLFVNGHGKLRPFSALDGQGQGNSVVSGVYPFDSGRKIVGIGHSMGAVALALSLAYTFPSYPSPSPCPSLTPGPIDSLILIEPMILNPGASLGVSDVLVGSVQRRRDKWGNRKEAGEVLGKSMKRQGWEGRCVRVFVEKGLRPETEGEAEGAVTLKCAREHEAACYRDPIGPMRLYTGIRTLVDALPVHVMYGAVEDNALPVAMKREVVDKCSGGAHRFGSVNWVQGGGHLVPYQNPSGVARGIVDALTSGKGGGGGEKVGKAKL